MSSSTATVPVRVPRAGDRVTEAEFRRIALGDDGRRWELHAGVLREKPGMSVEHGGMMTDLVVMLANQLDRHEFVVRAGHARLWRSPRHAYVPDIAVIPAADERALRQRPGALDAYAQPLSLVVEIWSPSTGDYDVDEKLPEYQARGDAEIWRLHPYERTLRVWRRRPDGGYDEATHRGGTVALASLPGVVVDLDALFAA